MVDFLLCIVQYVIIMVILAGIGILGGFIGIKLRKSKDAKAASAKAEELPESAGK
ncbi:MAG: hypothetical protein PUE81_09600 [Lachnospiraceae bacterium]|nr:hypothetical protein [Lachnospiraceae bacterium]MDY3275349.1 hypothetical protein [Agathobacter sp.]